MYKKALKPILDEYFQMYFSTKKLITKADANINSCGESPILVNKKVKKENPTSYPEPNALDKVICRTSKKNCM